MLMQFIKKKRLHSCQLHFSIINNLHGDLFLCTEKLLLFSLHPEATIDAVCVFVFVWIPENVKASHCFENKHLIFQGDVIAHLSNITLWTSCCFLGLILIPHIR